MWKAEAAFVAALSSCKADILIELCGQCMLHYNPPKFRLIMIYSWGVVWALPYLPLELNFRVFVQGAFALGS